MPPARGDWRLGLPPAQREGLPERIGAVQFDSRAVRPGDLFVCVPGERFDGHAFAPQAVAAGAVALIAAADRADALRALGVPVAAVPDPRLTLSAVAAAHEGYPARRLTVIGITGTDGKSTTAFLTHAALEGCGVRTGLLTTVQTRIAGRVVPNPTRLTTQEAPVVQQLLAEMVDAGCTHAIVEATSHGLALHRLDDCAFDIAVFTNLSSDHLDFHGTIEAYRDAKARLFTMLDAETGKAGPRAAIVNADDPAAAAMHAATRAPRWSYSLASDAADVTAREIVSGPRGSTYTASVRGHIVRTSVPIPARFNVLNALAALGVAAALGLDIERAAAGIASCAGVPGRMERISVASDEAEPFDAIVDYAHTGEALTQVLRTLRPLVAGRLIVVFGCAGERARERRTGLGSAAALLADYSVLTEEDPRSEDPTLILDEIAAAMIAAGAREGAQFERVPDRRAAIRRAVMLAQPGDLVLVAGKGHESSIERADGPHPWDDRDEVRAAIAARAGGQGARA